MKAAKKASQELLKLDDDKIKKTLLHVADTLEGDTDIILQANALDMDKIAAAGNSPYADGAFITIHHLHKIILLKISFNSGHTDR